MKRKLKYGDKRDYPKIDITVDNIYAGTTTWARTCKEAIRAYICMNPDETKNRKVKARFQKS